MDEPLKSKRDELKTYRLLGLARVPKGKKKRAQLEHRGLEKVIGGDSPDRPALKISQSKYWEVREIVYREFLESVEATGYDGTLEELLEKSAPELERRIYERFNKTLASEGGGKPYQNYREGVVNDVLDKIRSIQKRNPDRYQRIWKEVAGEAFAKESWLHRVDEVKGIAYLRCFNSALGFQLSKRNDLARILGEKLGVKITAIRMS